MYYNDEFYKEEIEEQPEILTPREVMDFLCIGRNSFYRLVNTGELVAFRIGKLWRVRREEVERFGKNTVDC